MRPVHLRLVLFLALAWALLAGCSKDVERIVANERLLRGQDVIGTTDRAVFDADRDTYVGVGQRNFGGTLLVGTDGAYEAESHLRVLVWSVPDTTVVIDSLYFAIPNDSTFIRSVTSPTVTIELADSAGGLAFPTVAKAYDLGTLRFDLPFTVIDSLRAWAGRPLTAPTFVLRSASPSGVAGFLAGRGEFIVRYHTVAAPGTILSAGSRAAVDSYTRTPLTPVPTGAETALLVGGRYETMVAVRARVPAIPPGYSLNEAAWVIHLGGIEGALEGNGFAADTYLDADVFRIGAPWAESISDTLGLGAGGAVPAVRFQKFDLATDSTLVVPIPLAWMRGWAADSTTNNGILIAFTRWREKNTTYNVYVPVGPDVRSAVRVHSRETASPPQIRISWTSPPPGRL